jgi:hypothetical protein
MNSKAPQKCNSFTKGALRTAFVVGVACLLLLIPVAVRADSNPAYNTTSTANSTMNLTGTIATDLTSGLTAAVGVVTTTGASDNSSSYLSSFPGPPITTTTPPSLPGSIGSLPACGSCEDSQGNGGKPNPDTGPGPGPIPVMTPEPSEGLLLLAGLCALGVLTAFRREDHKTETT